MLPAADGLETRREPARLHLIEEESGFVDLDVGFGPSTGSGRRLGGGALPLGEGVQIEAKLPDLQSILDVQDAVLGGVGVDAEVARQVAVATTCVSRCVCHDRIPPFGFSDRPNSFGA